MSNQYFLGSIPTLMKCYRELEQFGDIQRVCIMVDQYLRVGWVDGIDKLREKKLATAINWMYELGRALEDCGQFQGAAFRLEKAPPVNHEPKVDEYSLEAF
jgi:hypothetical protein